MSTKPTVLVVSSSKTKPKSLIKLITKSSESIESLPDCRGVALPWEISTKYYTAEINFLGMDEAEYAGLKELPENVEAIIIHMDSNRATGLEDLAAWASLMEQCDPDIKLLVANYINEDTRVSKVAATHWCLERGFELVELYAADEKILGEKYGAARIVEALESHTWPNLVMKDGDSKHGGEGLSLTDDFSDLFAQLSMMKDSLKSVSAGHRKQCAEQVVTTFWKAIGGSDDELADL